MSVSNARPDRLFVGYTHTGQLDESAHDEFMSQATPRLLCLALRFYEPARWREAATGRQKMWCVRRRKDEERSAEKERRRERWVRDKRAALCLANGAITQGFVTTKGQSHTHTYCID